MNLLIEDSPRNLAGWVSEATVSGFALGGVFTPFATPWIHQRGAGKKRGAREAATLVRSEGSRVWFDPTTHALQMGGVGDFRYYDEYNLWDGPRGDLSSSALRDGHVRRVFATQDELGSARLAPTILLHHGLSNSSEIALDMSRIATGQGGEVWVSIAGTAPFWASGGALDAHIGALAQLDPAGWFLTVARPLNTLPVEPEVEEIHGLCRTVRALSEYAPVHVSHGDLAALPAVAAGARTVGTGWDKRQRVCSFTDYGPRETGGEGGGWYERPSIGRLLGSLTVNEAAVLAARDAQRVEALGGLPAPGPREAFFHHLAVLDGLIGRVQSAPDYERKYEVLMEVYGDAATEWPAVVTLTGSPLGALDWVDPLRAGLALYGATEGWL
jgi:hypothetical protein